MSVKIIYSDIAIGADKGAAVSATPWADFSAPALLPFGADTGAVATCELNAWGLSHEYKVKGTQPFAFWSEEISNENGDFTYSPHIKLDFDSQYTSTGLSIRFSPDANEYCSQITVVWYQNGVEKERGIFYPDKGLYALENAVEAFDSISIYLEKTHQPYRRAKVEYIAIGIVREFDGTELTEAKVTHEIDLISDTVPVNVLDASFHSNGNAEFIFQRKQPVEAYNGKDLIGVYYIETGERTSSQNYTISCQDAIGVLDLDTYGGGLWLTDTPVITLLNDVIGGLFDIELDAVYEGATLRGYIEPDLTRREALQHIAFALGACVDTSGTKAIKIFAPKTGEGVTIPPTETYQGGKVKTSDTVTKVLLTYYDIYSGTPKGDDEEIKFKGLTYGCAVQTVEIENPNISSGTLPNAVEYDGCYLINTSNARTKAQSILDYYMRRNVYSTKHVVSGQNMGERANVTMPWGETANANILKMSITVSGIVASDTEFLLD